MRRIIALLILSLLISTAFVGSAEGITSRSSSSRSYSSPRSTPKVSAPRSKAVTNSPSKQSNPGKTTPKTTKPAPKSAPKSSSKPSTSTPTKKASPKVTSSNKRPSNAVYSRSKGIVGSNGYSPQFRGYTAPQGSVVYYPQHSFVDYLPWIYLFSQSSPRNDAATVIQPDSKEVKVQPVKEGTDGLVWLNWFILFLLGVGLIALISWGVYKWVNRK